MDEAALEASNDNDPIGRIQSVTEPCPPPESDAEPEWLESSTPAPSERLAYLTVVASMMGTALVLSREATGKLGELCLVLDLPDHGSLQVLAAAARPTASIRRHLATLRSSPLRFSLLADCLSLAHADGEYSERERREIEAIARSLDIDAPRCDAPRDPGCDLP